jgi:hypothetical protein
MEMREKAATDAEARLKNIASQEPDRERTELPETPDLTDNPVDGITQASKQKRKATSRKLNGLI